MNNLYERCDKYFELVIADTPELLHEVYRIRYQVLCVEERLPGFDVSLYADGIEKDSYDRHSVHLLLRYRATGIFIGTARLILRDPLDPEKPFPVELYTQFDPALCDVDKLGRQYTAEISRFVVIGQFNQRRAERRNIETRKNDSSSAKNDRRTTPHLVLVLMAGVFLLSVKYNICNWVSSMYPALNRLLSFYGLDFNAVGPLVNHHGLRKPYFIKIADVMDRMHRHHYAAWEVLTEYSRKQQNTLNSKEFPFLNDQIEK